MRRYYPYDNCRNSAEAIDKIEFNGTSVDYFPDSETAGHYLNEYAKHNDFPYDWYTKNTLDEHPLRNWGLLQIGSAAYLRAFANAWGIE